MKWVVKKPATKKNVKVKLTAANKGKRKVAEDDEEVVEAEVDVGAMVRIFFGHVARSSRVFAFSSIISLDRSWVLLDRAILAWLLSAASDQSSRLSARSIRTSCSPFCASFDLEQRPLFLEHPPWPPVDPRLAETSCTMMRTQGHIIGCRSNVGYGHGTT